MKQAQATVEYILLIGIAAAAIIAASVYISRSFQGRLRQQTNILGEQYSPRNMSTNIRQDTTVTYTDKLIKDESWNDTRTVTTTRANSYERARDLRYERY